MAGTSETTRESVRRVFRNPRLRRLQLAFVGSLTGDWAYATAITVWAFQEGGATAVGVFQAVRFVAMAVAGPLGAVVADRVSRKTFMMTTDLVRAGLVSTSALVLITDGPAAIIYCLSVVAAMVGAPFRSAQAGLVPKLVESPAELTASNAVSANLENIVTFVGPALGALLVGVTGIAPVFWLNVASFLWSFALVSSIRVPAREPAVPVEDGDAPQAEESEGFLRDVTAGFATIARNGDLRTVSLLAAAQGLVWGALTVFMVIIAIEMLGTGPEGVGYLSSVLGAATIAGGLMVLTRVSKGRLGQDMTTGVLGWAIPLIALAAFPSPVTAIAALVVIGASDPWVNVGFETIPQRLAPEHVISRVYAAVESGLIAAMALGAFVAPLMVRWIGFRESMLAIGVLVTAYAASTVPHMRGLDSRLREPAELPLLRRIGIFAPLSGPVLESLAHQLQRVSVPAGGTILREGESSDRFYVIEAGSVEVTQAGRLLRTEGPGDFFGEIGLLRDVPRTATVTATADTELLALERNDFLEAVTGVSEATAAAEEVVSRRLAV